MDERDECPNRERNAESCPCKVRDCPRLGVCCECIEFHRGQGEPTACYAEMQRHPTKQIKKGETADLRDLSFRLTDYASCAG
jgi:hypothetical protein